MGASALATFGVFAAARKLRVRGGAQLAITFEQTEAAFHRTPAGKEPKVVRAPALAAAVSDGAGCAHKVDRRVSVTNAAS